MEHLNHHEITQHLLALSDTCVTCWATVFLLVQTHCPNIVCQLLWTPVIIDSLFCAFCVGVPSRGTWGPLSGSIRGPLSQMLGSSLNSMLACLRLQATISDSLNKIWFCRRRRGMAEIYDKEKLQADFNQTFTFNIAANNRLSGCWGHWDSSASRTKQPPLIEPHISPDSPLIQHRGVKGSRQLDRSTTPLGFQRNTGWLENIK